MGSEVPLEVAILVGLAVIAVIVTAIFLYFPRPKKPFLDKTRKRAMIMDVHELSNDTKRFRLSLGSKDVPLGLPVAQHIRLYAPNPESCLAKGTWNGKPDPDRGSTEIFRSYTPTPATDSAGYVELAIKIYRPGKFRMPDGKEVDWEDGGKMSRYLDSKKVGDYIDIMGPTGMHEYVGCGKFKLGPNKTIKAQHFGLLSGGAGITPMLQLVHAALRDPEDTCTFSLLYANKTEDDILVRDMLELEARSSTGRFKLHFTVDFPPENWQHHQGFISADMIKQCLPAPELNPIILMCGPPPMINFACKPNLEKLGYDMTRTASF